MKLRAWNVFSSLEVDVDMFAACDEDLLVKLNVHNDYLLRYNNRLVKCFILHSTAVIFYILGEDYLPIPE